MLDKASAGGEAYFNAHSVSAVIRERGRPTLTHEFIVDRRMAEWLDLLQTEVGQLVATLVATNPFATFTHAFLLRSLLEGATLGKILLADHKLSTYEMPRRERALEDLAGREFDFYRQQTVRQLARILTMDHLELRSLVDNMSILPLPQPVYVMTMAQEMILRGKIPGQDLTLPTATMLTDAAFQQAAKLRLTVTRLSSARSPTAKAKESDPA